MSTKFAQQPEQWLGAPQQATTAHCPALCQEAQQLLANHGCTFSAADNQKHVQITYPDGTTKREIYPRLNLSEKYWVYFPDGYEIMEMYDWPRKISLLFYR